MRKFAFSLVCSVLFVALSASAALGAAEGTDRPWKVAGSATGIIMPGTPTTIVIEGTVQAAHLGRTRFQNVVICTLPDCSTGGANTFTFVAANGDTLTASGENVGERTFTGGTGRFAEATGSFTFTATSVAFDPSNPLVFRLTFTETGTISY